MNYCKNILLIILVAALPTTSLLAQHKKKKKATHTKTSVSHAAAVKPVRSRGRYRKGTTTSRIVEDTLSGTYNGKVKSIVLLPRPKSPNGKDEPVKVTLINDTTANPVDTAPSQNEVVITSSFKPSLRNAAKINFTAATPLLDTTLLQLTYNIPSQNLFFSYEPVPLKPLALAPDSALAWNHDQYVKLGYGNYASPYLEAGASLGNGTQSMITAHGKYTAAKGSLPFQQYSKAGIDVLGIYTTKTNQEITGKFFWDNNTVYRYGYQPDSLKFTKDSLRQKFNTIGVELGLENKLPTGYGIVYHPQVHFNVFSNTSNTKETNLLLKLPLSKMFGKLFTLALAPTVSLNHYTYHLANDSTNINNNLFYFNTSVLFNTPNFKLNLGLVPGWANSNFSLLPNFTAEGRLLKDKKLIVEAGWVGSFQQNTYRTLAGINPYIVPPTSLGSTKTIEEYIGLKGSLGKHLTANARLSFVQLDDMPLFVNDTTTGKNQNFLVVNAPTIQALRIKGEISYAVQEKVAILAGATYTQFTKVSGYEKAYGLLPLEINGALRWKVLNELTLKSDIAFFDAGSYRTQTLGKGKLNPAFDVNLGGEFPVMKHLNAWVQFNNLLNNHYQRWNQYQVLGFQLLAGVVYSFR
ncbi:hypothetical protein [Parasediminibacterium sp. JCM 36343]|uniref:hypothetical protein n=1 Tax=Parasediminibacterium sp. JCM 36343 TaxID=3374279 RepID=UPI0039796541